MAGFWAYLLASKLKVVFNHHPTTMGSNVSRPDSVKHTSADEKRQEWHIVSSMNSLNLTKTPISTTGSLTLERVADWETEVSSDPKTRLARTILSHSEIRSALSSRSAQIADTFIFNNSLDFKTGPITNQRSSGRCWIFASTNVTRYAIMKKLKLDDFQLSQSYLYFWDKLNKANYFLELSIENAHLPIDDRLVNHLSGSDLLSDGGQWDMFVNLAENYGFVPQTVFPESTHSSLSSPLNSLLKTKLREHGLVLRKTAASLRAAYVPAAQAVQALRAKKEELMKDIYTVMTATLGVPPKPDQKFVWEYKDKDGVTGSWEGTPTEFFNQFATKPYKPSESFSLINDPRNEYGKLYTIDKLGNIWGARPVLYVNTEIQVLKDTVVKMIKADHPVFFGCDVGQFSDKTTGIMDPALYEYEDAFNITLGLTKAERLQLNESAMTHAMVISGVHLDQDGKPVRYKVENSWGDAVGDHGFFVMTDKWFEEFVYQVVVPKPLAPKDLTAVFEAGDKVVLPPWDPLGTLA